LREQERLLRLIQGVKKWRREDWGRRAFEHGVGFRGAAFWLVNQAEADAALELTAAHGINHIDVSPTYGQGEIHLGRG